VYRKYYLHVLQARETFIKQYNYGFVQCSILYFVTWVTILRKNLLPSSSGHFILIKGPEYDGSNIQQCVLCSIGVAVLC